MANKKNIIGELDLVLKPSKIEGIGVFANSNIKNGTIFPYDKKDRLIKIKDARKNKKLHQMCERYCVQREEDYLCPPSFQKMHVLWFLNHSKKPNLMKGKKCFIAKKNITKGKEILVDYHNLDSPIDNANYFNKKWP
ncbi:MAG: SET domain-containing protein [Nanoarchaeota archaeon]